MKKNEIKKVMIVFLGRKNSGPSFSYELANGFAESGCEVHAIISNQTDHKERWDGNCKIKKYYIDTYKNKFDFTYESILLPIKIKNLMKTMGDLVEFDVIVSTFFHPWVWTLIKKLRYKKVVTFCHDPIMHPGESVVKRLLYYSYVKKSNEVAILTKQFECIMKKKYGFPSEKIHYVKHGLLNIKRYKSKRTLDVIKGNTNFIFFGRIKKYKGLSYTLDAYELLKEKYDNVSLYVVGDGDISIYESQIKRLSNVFVYNNYIPEEDIDAFFSIPNLVCVLSYTEATQSGVIPIAIEYGVPVIASRTGGLIEQLDGGNIGILFESENVEELSKCMERFLCEPNLYRNESLELRKKIDELDWRNIAQKFILDCCE